ncbi:MAG: hypothetical protein PHT51_02300 [Patescibacteria group bacterium]|nr:hypothetical protein [Patescibacteria group bacterium]MDD4610794.1 hypothetical protein [Patescibacteria group bacterium]
MAGKNGIQKLNDKKTLRRRSETLHDRFLDSTVQDPQFRGSASRKQSSSASRAEAIQNLGIAIGGPIFLGSGRKLIVEEITPDNFLLVQELGGKIDPTMLPPPAKI